MRTCECVLLTLTHESSVFACIMNRIRLCQWHFWCSLCNPKHIDHAIHWITSRCSAYIEQYNNGSSGLKAGDLTLKGFMLETYIILFIYSSNRLRTIFFPLPLCTLYVHAKCIEICINIWTLFIMMTIHEIQSQDSIFIIMNWNQAQPW